MRIMVISSNEEAQKNFFRDCTPPGEYNFLMNNINATMNSFITINRDYDNFDQDIELWFIKKNIHLYPALCKFALGGTDAVIWLDQSDGFDVSWVANYTNIPIKDFAIYKSHENEPQIHPYDFVCSVYDKKIAEQQQKTLLEQDPFINEKQRVSKIGFFYEQFAAFKAKIFKQSSDTSNDKILNDKSPSL